MRSIVHAVHCACGPLFIGPLLRSTSAKSNSGTLQWEQKNTTCVRPPCLLSLSQACPRSDITSETYTQMFSARGLHDFAYLLIQQMVEHDDLLLQLQPADTQRVEHKGVGKMAACCVQRVKDRCLQAERVTNRMQAAVAVPLLTLSQQTSCMPMLSISVPLDGQGSRCEQGATTDYVLTTNDTRGSKMHRSLFQKGA